MGSFAFAPTIFVKLVLLSSVAFAYINIEQYCRAFDDNFRPMICILKNANNGSLPVDRPYPQESTKPEYPVLFPNKHRQRPRPRPRPKPRPAGRPPIRHPPAIYPIYVQPHPPPDYHNHNGWEDDDEADCSCDLNCYPIISNPATNMTGVTYKCRTCGSSCWVKSPTPSNCSCAVPSGNATCSCVATCASFRNMDEYKIPEGAMWRKNPLSRNSRMSYPSYHSYDYDDSNSAEDFNCIFTISNLTDMRVGMEQRPYNCDCCKSTAAVQTNVADFVCICQRLSGLDRADY